MVDEVCVAADAWPTSDDAAPIHSILAAARAAERNPPAGLGRDPRPRRDARRFGGRLGGIPPHARPARALLRPTCLRPCCFQGVKPGCRSVVLGHTPRPNGVGLPTDAAVARRADAERSGRDGMTLTSPGWCRGNSPTRVRVESRAALRLPPEPPVVNPTDCSNASSASPASAQQALRSARATRRYWGFMRRGERPERMDDSLLVLLVCGSPL